MTETRIQTEVAVAKAQCEPRWPAGSPKLFQGEDDEDAKLLGSYGRARHDGLVDRADEQCWRTISWYST